MIAVRRMGLLVVALLVTSFQLVAEPYECPAPPYQVEAVGVANVGDFMRVKTVDQNGEVETMEALPAGDILSSFSTVSASAAESNVAKVISIQAPPVPYHWHGSFLVSNSGEFFILNLHVWTEGTGLTQINGAITAATGSGFEVYYDGGLSGYNIYVGASNHTKQFSGFTLLNTNPDLTTFYIGAGFTDNGAGKTGVASVASIDDDSGNLLADEIRPISNTGNLTINSPLTGIDLISFGNLSLSSTTGKITFQDSVAWNEVGTAGNPAFQNGWGNLGSDLAVAAYRKMPTGEVHIKGVVSGGTANTVIFTLPSGYRPQERRLFPIDISTGAHGRLTIRTNGEVLLEYSGASQTTYSSIEVVFYP